jgi:chorismate mutase
MSLARVRTEIDELDRELIKLLSKRMQLALSSKHYKKEVEDLDRENDIDSNLKSLAKEYELDYSYLKKIYNIIFQEGKKQQKNEY